MHHMYIHFDCFEANFPTILAHTPMTPIYHGLDFHDNEKILKKIRGIGKFPIDKKN